MEEKEKERNRERKKEARRVEREGAHLQTQCQGLE